MTKCDHVHDRRARLLKNSWVAGISLFAVFLSMACALSTDYCLATEAIPSVEPRETIPGGPFRIMLVHSYHRSDWSEGISRGVESILGGRPEVEIDIEYLDTKKCHSPEYLSALSTVISMKHGADRFSTVIAADNNAFDFVRENRGGLFSSVPVVFCGFNGFSMVGPDGKASIPGMEMVTGVNEQPDFISTIDFGLKVRPGAKKGFLVLTDTTATGQINLSIFDKDLAKLRPDLKYEIMGSGSYGEIEKRMKAVSPDTFVYHISFWQDSAGENISPDRLGALFRKCPAPVLGRSEWMLGKGMTGGMCVSAFHQGEMAAKLAERVLRGESADSIPVVMQSPNRFFIDCTEMARLNIPLEKAPQGAIVLNPPPPFLQFTKREAIIASWAVAVLLGLITALYLNILKKRRTETALRQSEGLYRTLVENISLGITLMDKDFNIIAVNPAQARLFGDAPQAFVSRKCHECFEARKEPCLICPGKEAMKSGKPSYLDTEGVLPDGTRFPLSLRAFPIMTADGEATGFIEVAEDLRETRRAMVERDRLFNLSIDMLCIAGYDGMFKQLNPAFTKVLGWKNEELLLIPWLDLVHPEDLKRTMDAGRDLESGREVLGFENRLRCRDGSYRWLSWNAFPLPGEGIFAVVRDISSEREARVALERSEARFRSIVDSSPMGIYLYEINKAGELVLTGINKAAEELTGIPSRDLIGNKILDAFPHLAETDIPERYRAVAMEGLSWNTTSMIYEDDRLKGVFDVFAFQTFPGMVAVMFNEVSERLSREKAILSSENDLKITLNSIGDGVIATDARGRITRMNPVAEELTGCPAAEAVGTTLGDIFHVILDFDRKPGPNPVDRVLETGQLVTMAEGTILIGLDGRERFISDSAAPIRDGDGKIVGAVLVFRDITERYRLEEQLRQSQKMDSIGRLAGGIAHDFNNMLAGIIGAAELLAMAVQGSEELMEDVEMIIESAQKASELTMNLLAFARKGKTISTPVDIHDAIRGAVGILSRSLDRMIEINLDLEADNPMVIGDPSQVQNVILNLCLNARDAMPSGGRITICTANRILSSEECDEIPFNIEPGDYLEIRVSDNGCGIHPTLLQRIFEPFFTTKEGGRGTGLGLSAVYGTMKAHGGAIMCNSNLKVENGPDRSTSAESGTTFTLLLPNEKMASMVRQLIKESSVGTATGTVLIVDDEPLVRKAATRLVEAIGYKAVSASDGFEGIEIFKTMMDEIDVVLLDMVMPGMNGIDCFREIRRLKPDARVIISSGFARDGGTGDLVSEGVWGFLKKPYLRMELSEILDKAVNGAL